MMDTGHDEIPQLVHADDVDVTRRISSALHNNILAAAPTASSASASSLSAPTTSPGVNPHRSPNLLSALHENALDSVPPPLELQENAETAAKPAKTEETGEKAPPVPLTILTGWLGSGKTTLLAHILAVVSARGQKVAIIQNEASALGVEDPAAMRPTDAESNRVFSDIIELSNGCVCCSVKNDFVLGLDTLLKRSRFDFIILECSGLADPGPLANLVWVDAELESRLYLDGIISLVDAVHLEANMRRGRPESKQVLHQLAYADRLILNKCDLVSEEKIEELKRKLAAINATAPILCSVRSQVDLSEILNINAFDLNDTNRAVHSFNQNNMNNQNSHDHDHSACGSECPGPNPAKNAAPAVEIDPHPHDHTITNLVFDCADTNKFVDLDRLKRWLAELLWEKLYTEKPILTEEMKRKPVNRGNFEVKMIENNEKNEEDGEESGRENEIFRLKAILAVKDDPHAYFLQGVQELFEINKGGQWDTLPAQNSEKADTAVLHTVSTANSLVKSDGLGLPHTRLVVIGRRLNQAVLQKGFDSIFCN